MLRRRKRVSVIFRTPLLQEAYKSLPDGDILKKRIDRVIEAIKQNPRVGQPISKKKIPKQYLNEGFNNAFWVDLSRDWRLIYSLRGLNEIEIIFIVLDWFDSHKEY